MVIRTTPPPLGPSSAATGVSSVSPNGGKVSGGVAAKSGERSDKVDVGDAAREASEVSATPMDGAKAEQIARLREQIASGTYRVDYETLATRLVDDYGVL